MPGTEKLSRPQSGDPVSKLWRHVERLVKVVERQAVEISALQALIGKRRPMTGGGGWNYRGAYDSETEYSNDDVAVVTPTNPAVASGAVPGIWLALQSADTELPVWPLPVPDDPDSASNFWWPLSFYPLSKTQCNAEGDEETAYFNATEGS